MNLIQHIEKNSKVWKEYVYGKQFLETRMEVHAELDED